MPKRYIPRARHGLARQSDLLISNHVRLGQEVPNLVFVWKRPKRHQLVVDLDRRERVSRPGIVLVVRSLVWGRESYVRPCVEAKRCVRLHEERCKPPCKSSAQRKSTGRVMTRRTHRRQPLVSGCHCELFARSQMANGQSRAGSTVYLRRRTCCTLPSTRRILTTLEVCFPQTVGIG